MRNDWMRGEQSQRLMILAVAALVALALIFMWLHG